MASLFNDINSSDDSDDADYNPENALHSSEEELGPLDCDEEIEVKKTKKGRAKEGAKDSTIENPTELISSTDKEKEKEKSAALYKSFLADVEEDEKRERASRTELSPKSALSSDISICSPVSTSGCMSGRKSGQVECAGERVSVPNESLDAQASEPVKKRGLAQVLDVIAKKQKVSTLNQSKLEWSEFKREKGLEEELTQYNRGRGGYVDRKRFLEKCDQKSFEIERDMRQNRRKK